MSLPYHYHPYSSIVILSFIISCVEVGWLRWDNKIIRLSNEMDSKMHRYMQRIERLMGTPNKTGKQVSPLSRSPAPKTNTHLDKYLKYELSAKIISSLLAKHHTRDKTSALNALRTVPLHHKERVFKFVGLEKKEPAREMRVDASISGKIMVAVLKQFMKKRVGGFLEALREGQNERLSSRKESEDRSARLMRTSSRPDSSNYKPVSEWIEDSSALEERSVLLKQIETLRRYPLKSIMKLVGLAVKRQQEWGLQALQQWKLHKEAEGLQGRRAEAACRSAAIAQQRARENEKWEQLERQYQSEIEALACKFAQPTVINNSLLSSGGKFQSKIPAKFQEEESLDLLRNNSDLLNIALRLKLKRKAEALIEIISLLRMVPFRNLSTLRTSKKIEGLMLLDRFFRRFKHNAYQRISNAVISMFDGKFQILCSCLERLFIRNSFRNYHIFMRELVSGTQIERQRKGSILLGESEFERANTSRSNFSNVEPYNPLVRLNFYSFLDKVYKLILVLSKLLIPIKEAFVRIDHYASYSFRLEESLAVLPRKYRQLGFDQIRKWSQRGEDNREDVLLRGIGVIQAGVMTRMVEVFSHLKVLAKQRELKIKILPAKQNVLEMTKRFLTERSEISQHSHQSWNRLKTQISTTKTASNPEIFPVVNNRLKSSR